MNPGPFGKELIPTNKNHTAAVLCMHALQYIIVDVGRDIREVLI